MKAKGAILIALLAISMLSLAVVSALGALPTERFLGYNTQKAKWTTGNLGKEYCENDFVSYQLRIDDDSKMWGASEFSISYNFFQASSGAIYIDGFDTSLATGFQWSTNGFLDNTQETPPGGWGTHIPTPDAGELPGTGATITNYMEAWPPGSTDGTGGEAPIKEHYFTVSNLPWPTDSDQIILFFRAHLALTAIWSNNLESSLPQSLSGTEFASWDATWLGSSFATGSSRHFTLQFEGVGDKTIPIPIVQYPEGMVSGYKYITWCGGGPIADNGWSITLEGTLLGGIPFSQTVVTGTAPWETGYFEFKGLIAGEYVLSETAKPGYSAAPPVPFTLARGGTFTQDFTNYGPAPVC